MAYQDTFLLVGHSFQFSSSDTLTSEFPRHNDQLYGLLLRSEAMHVQAQTKLGNSFGDTLSSHTPLLSTVSSIYKSRRRRYVEPCDGHLPGTTRHDPHAESPRQQYLIAVSL